MSKRGGLMGLLGGLALGGLLGSLFFGGAFENFNFMDILIFGGISFLLFKLFAAKAAHPATSTAYHRYNDDARPQTESFNSNYQSENNTVTNNAGVDTDIFSKKGQIASVKASDQLAEEKLVEGLSYPLKILMSRIFWRGLKALLKYCRLPGIEKTLLKFAACQLTRFLQKFNLN